MSLTTKQALIGFAAAAAVAAAIGGPVIANAASSAPSSAPSQSPAPPTDRPGAPGMPGDHGRHHGDRPRETPLSGATADKVKAAALTAVPGGTVLRVETDGDGSAYEAHVRKPDGTEVEVKVDKAFHVTAVETRPEHGHFGPPGGPGGPGDRAGHPAETPLSGATADKVKAAVLAKVPGATIERMETDSDGAAYEAHIRKPDGTPATVKLDKAFAVTAVESR